MNLIIYPIEYQNYQIHIKTKMLNQIKIQLLNR
jgi:hypothetical protein